MPNEPSISLSGSIQVGAASTALTPVYYKRNVPTKMQVGTASITPVTPIYKRTLHCDAPLGLSETSVKPVVAHNLSGSWQTGNLNPRLTPAFKLNAVGQMELGAAVVKLDAAKKIAIRSMFRTGDTTVELDGRVAHNLNGQFGLGSSEVDLERIHRKIVPPPPTFDLYVQTANGDIPLQGAKLYRGSSYRLVLRGRGYYLNTLELAKGPQLRFTVKTGLGDPNATLVFAKSTHQPLSGIGIDSVQRLTITEDGELEELNGQVRIYPTDTTKLQPGRSHTLYWELQMVDPLSERPEPLRGTLALVP